MSIILTSRDILIAHIHLCHSLKVPAELRFPNVLVSIEQQLSGNLDWLNRIEVAAYVGHQIIKQKPFAYANKATAAALTMAIIGSGSKLRPADVSVALETSSVVDDVADQLILLGAA